MLGPCRPDRVAGIAAAILLLVLGAGVARAQPGPVPPAGSVPVTAPTPDRPPRPGDQPIPTEMPGGRVAPPGLGPGATGAAAPVGPIGQPPRSLGAPPAAVGVRSGPPGSAAVVGPVVGGPPLPILPRLPARPDEGAPGLPPRGGRPNPGSPFDPGSSGPGIEEIGSEYFLGGAFDPSTGWPFVLLDHFAPRPERMETLWIVQTRYCPQELGSDPWGCLRVLHFDANGVLIERPVAELFAQAAGRPVLIQVQGSLTTPDIALGGLLWTHSWLQLNRALPADAVVVAFDWPSQRVHPIDVIDINEKGRRAFVAGYHLARFVQGFPPASRLCLLGQSYGTRVVTSALHLLGGGSLQVHDEGSVRLAGLRPDLHLRAVVIGAAVDRHWLNPGQKLDRALTACEGYLNLYNRRDEALILYPFLYRSEHRRALGRAGMKPKHLEQLGPLAARYAEFDTHDLLRAEHTLLDAVANPVIARWIAPYTWSPDPGPPRLVPHSQEALRRSIRAQLRWLLD